MSGGKKLDIEHSSRTKETPVPPTDVDQLAKDPLALARSYGKPGAASLLKSGFVLRCALFAAMGGFLFGYDQGVISLTLVMKDFNERFPQIDRKQHSHAGFWKGFLTAFLELGALLGAIQAGWVADRFSRKYALVTGFTWFIVGSAIQTGSVTYVMLVVGRFVGGIGIGILSMTAPLFISEIAPPHTRGALLVLEELSIVFGIVVAFYITYSTRHIVGDWSWRLPFFLQIIPAILLLACMRSLPFSPRWLAIQGKDSRALDVLVRLRKLPREDPRVCAEWLEVLAEARVRSSIQRERYPHLAGKLSLGSSVKLEALAWRDTFRPGVARRTLVGIFLMFFQQFVGINALIYYSPSLLETLGLDAEMQLHISGAINVAQLIGILPSIFLMDYIGRRTLLLLGSIAMAVCHTIVAGLVGTVALRNPAASWVGVSFIIIYMLAFGLSWGPVPWAMPAEIFPSSMRAKGVALSTSSNWSMNFIIGLITPPFIEKSPAGTFAFFAGFSVLSGIWTWFAVPETKGKRLEDMDAVWGDEEGKRDRERIEEMVGILKSEKQ